DGAVCTIQRTSRGGGVEGQGDGRRFRGGGGAVLSLDRETFRRRARPRVIHAANIGFGRGNGWNDPHCDSAGGFRLQPPRPLLAGRPTPADWNGADGRWIGPRADPSRAWRPPARPGCPTEHWPGPGRF